MSILKLQRCGRYGPSTAATIIALLLCVQSLAMAGVQDAQSTILAIHVLSMALPQLALRDKWSLVTVLCGSMRQQGQGGEGGRGSGGVPLTLNNDDCILTHDIIQPIQYLLCSLDLPKALVQGAVLHVDHLCIAHVRKGNGRASIGWLPRHPGMLLCHLVALQGLFADASCGKILEKFGTQRPEIAGLRLLKLAHSSLLALWQSCTNPLLNCKGRGDLLHCEWCKQTCLIW